MWKLCELRQRFETTMRIAAAFLDIKLYNTKLYVETMRIAAAF